MVCSSPVRSSGIVVTATAPALTTPNHAAESHWLLGPRSSTRFPGTMPTSSTRSRATRFAAAIRSAYDHVGMPGWCRHGRSAPCRAATSSSRAVAQFRRSGNWSSGSSKVSSGHCSAGGRWSRQNVSTWADGSSSMADNVCPVRDDGQEDAICSRIPAEIDQGSAMGPGPGATNDPVSLDDRALTLAIAQAKLAASLGELPYGAVVVGADGEVFGAAHDQVVTTHDLTAHAEMLAVRQATTSHGWLAGASLVATVEP